MLVVERRQERFAEERRVEIMTALYKMAGHEQATADHAFTDATGEEVEAQSISCRSGRKRKKAERASLLS